MVALLLAGLVAFQPTPTSPAAAEPPAVTDEMPQPSAVEVMRMEAGRLLPTVTCEDAQRFLLGTSFLLFPGERTIYHNRAQREALTPEDFEKLPPEAREGFVERKISEQEYYYTRYGSPLAYTRPLELLCQVAGRDAFRGKKIFDYGYGTAGHLRLLAQMGMQVTGVEVDPVLKALYSQPDDTGTVAGSTLFNETLADGTLTLLHGQWPAEPGLMEKTGEGYDYFISKNTLKNGYINPEKPVDKRMLVDLGVPRDEFVKQVAKALKPGGLFMIYNICPAQKLAAEKWIPWADGRSPFTREMYEAAGFEVIHFDESDDEAVRQLGKALEWDKGTSPMDLEGDCFATYTLVRKKKP